MLTVRVFATFSAFVIHYNVKISSRAGCNFTALTLIDIHYRGLPTFPGLSLVYFTTLCSPIYSRDDRFLIQQLSLLCQFCYLHHSQLPP